MQRGARSRQSRKNLPVEPGWASRGHCPQPVTAVLVAEPYGVGWQALGRGVGGKDPVAVAQQAGRGRDPQAAGFVFEQVVDRVAFELRGIFCVEGDKVDAVEAHQAPVRAQPHVAVPGLQDGVDCVLGQPGIRTPCLVAKVVERSLGIKRQGGVRQRKEQHPQPSPDVPHHDGSSMNPKKTRPETGRVENWYVIAIPKIGFEASPCLGPRVRIPPRPFGGDQGTRSAGPISVPTTNQGVPHISLVLCEMWDATAADLHSSALQGLPIEVSGIPYLA